MGHPTRKVLLALNDVQRAASLVGWLRELGYSTIRTRDGASALLAVHKEQPDAVVADADLPILDGYQLVTALRSHPASPRLPVILFIPSGDDQEIARGCEAGADVCLPQQGSPSDLLLSLERILRGGERVERLTPFVPCVSLLPSSD